jgi:hypothetical protein
LPEVGGAVLIEAFPVDALADALPTDALVAARLADELPAAALLDELSDGWPEVTTVDTVVAEFARPDGARVQATTPTEDDSANAAIAIRATRERIRDRLPDVRVRLTQARSGVEEFAWSCVQHRNVEQEEKAPCAQAASPRCSSGRA